MFIIKEKTALSLVIVPSSEQGTMGTSLAVQWLRLCASSAGGMGSIPGQGTKIPHATQRGKKTEKNKEQWK